MSEPEQSPMRPGKVRGLWIAAVSILILTIAAEFVVELHPHFEWEALFAFHAVYGILTCIVIVAFAWLLGSALKRKDTYYDD